MPGGRAPDESEGEVPPKLSFWERLRKAVVKPVEPGTGASTKASDEPQSVEELQSAVKFANDKERIIGLLAAPVAAAIGILVITALIEDDPPAFLKNGQVNKLHVSLSLYHDLAGVLLGLSVLMLAAAFFRKRLFLGILMALYGLAVFNLHYWGFGLPFILFGAWLLVRAYRLQRSLRDATGDGSSSPGASRRGGAAAPGGARPQPSKRYTPPTPASKRSLPPKPENEQKAG